MFEKRMEEERIHLFKSSNLYFLILCLDFECEGRMQDEVASASCYQGL